MFWLYNFDPEIQKLKSNKKGTLVFFATIDWSFSILHLSIEKVVNLQKQIESFNNAPDEAIFAISFAGTNHWLSIVAHKTKTKLTFYLLDSENRQ